MNQLTPAQFTHARNFIHREARPLEKALFAFYFEGGGRGPVDAALAAFRNPDGGFGRALEADLRTDRSSILATLTALHLLRDLSTPADHPLLAGALRFLREAYDAEKRVWRFIPPDADDAPHAPWWSQEDLEKTFDGFRVNPRVALLSYLLEHPAAFAPEIGRAIYPEVVADLNRQSGPLGVNDLQCYVTLVEGPGLPAGERARMIDRVADLLDQSIERDPAQWKSYVVRPLDCIHSPDSPFYARFQLLVDQQLDDEIDDQAADGSWSPNWSWFGAFDDDWPRARRDWQGVITLERLRTLDRFGRIAR